MCKRGRGVGEGEQKLTPTPILFLVDKHHALSGNSGGGGDFWCLVQTVANRRKITCPNSNDQSFPLKSDWFGDAHVA